MTDTAEYDFISKIFLGDNNVQKSIIASLGTALRTKPAVHMVFGGARSGKDTAIQKVEAGFAQDGSFVRMAPRAARNYLDTQSLSELKGALKDLVDDQGKEFDPILGRLKLFESTSDNPHEVLFIDSEVNLPHEAEKIRQVMKALQKLPKEVTLSILLNVGNLQEPLLPAVQQKINKSKNAATQKCLEVLAKDYPELVVHRTAYNYDQVKAGLWNAMQQQDATIPLLQKCLKIWNVDIKHPAVRDVISALKERSRTKYDIAFQRIPSAEVHH